MTEVLNPLSAGPIVAVSAVGAAEGARGAAAALACAGAEVGRATLLIEMGGRPPRPTLLASAAAQRVEQRTVTHLPQARVAARGSVCHLAVPAAEAGFEAASAAANVARGSLVVLLLPPTLLRKAVEEGAGPRLTGVLLRVDLPADRPLLALAARDLAARDLRVGVLKHRLSWVTERRALFGALPPGTPGGLLPALVHRVMWHPCYGPKDDSEADSARTAEPERGDHASAGSR